MPCQQHSLCNSNKLIGFTNLDFSKIVCFIFDGAILGWVDVYSLHSRKSLVQQQILRNDIPSVFLWLPKNVDTYPHINIPLTKHKHTFYFLALLKRLSLHLLIDILNLCRSYLLHYTHVRFVPLPHMMSPIHVTSPVRNLSYTLPGIFATSPGLMMCFNKINFHIHFL